MAPLNYLSQHEQNEEQHDLYGHVIPLASASQDTHSAVNYAIEFLTSR